MNNMILIFDLFNERKCQYKKCLYDCTVLIYKWNNYIGSFVTDKRQNY